MMMMVREQDRAMIAVIRRRRLSLDALRTRDGRDRAPQQQQQMNTESGEEGGDARARILALAQHQRQDEDGK